MRRHHPRGSGSGGTSDIDTSKEIVRVLRHGKYDLAMDVHGYVDVADILKAFSDHGFAHLTRNDIERIVTNDRKGRYELNKEGNVWRIRATQGHTVQVENPDLELLTQTNKYTDVIHGTKMYRWNSIALSGLHKMNRQHIHFCIGLPGDRAVISGMPPGCDVAIYLDVPKAIRAGLKLYESKNKVILCEGDHKGRIHPKFFKKVIHIGTGEIKFPIPDGYQD